MSRNSGLTCRRRGAVLLALLTALIAAPAIAAPPVDLGQTLTRARVVAALPGLEALARRAVGSGDTPGLAVAVVFNDEVLYLKGFGVREVGRPELVDADTVFQIASLSKPITSTVVAALVTKKLVTWDSRIADLDPAFALHDPYPTAEVTVRDMLNHRSGLPGGAGGELEIIGYPREEMLHRLRLVTPSSSFRAGYSYSNAGFTEGAVAAARPTGQSWKAAAQERLFGPLGMASTSMTYADFLSRPDRAALHVRVGGVWAAAIKRDPDPQAPAGGVSSTVRDLAQWMRLELSNGMHDGVRVIAAAALDETHAPLMARGVNPVTGAPEFYGLGWVIDYDRHGLLWGHAGAFSAGARTSVALFPNAGLGVVVLSNAFPNGVPEGLEDSFADLVFDGRPGPDWLKSWNAMYAGLLAPGVATQATYAKPPSLASPALAPTAYAGRYANAFLGDAVVTSVAGGLKVTVGPGGKRTYALRHFDRDLFIYFPDPETPDNPYAARFAVGPDGRATALTLESLDGAGMGTLARVGN